MNNTASSSTQSQDAQPQGIQPQGTQLQVFAYDNVSTGQRLSLSAIEVDGQAWFVASDVCKALGLHPTAIRRLDEDEKGLRTMQTLGGQQQVTIINESGLYSLIFSSRKASATQFKKWVTADVLPAIRKHGGYINGMETLPQVAQQETLTTIQDAAAKARARHMEDKEARSTAFRFMRRGW